MLAQPPRKPTAARCQQTPAPPRQQDEVAWRSENAETIAHQNLLVEKEGAFGDDLRTI